MIASVRLHSRDTYLSDCKMFYAVVVSLFTFHYHGANWPESLPNIESARPKVGESLEIKSVRYYTQVLKEV